MKQNFNWANGPNTFYEILQVQPSAEPDVIKAAFRAIQKKCHPDHGGSNDLAAKVNDAMTVLLNPKTRKAYDKHLLKKNGNLIGNYEVLEEISEGGFGRTYKARHVLVNELACLKQNLNVSPDDTEIMMQEAKLLWDIHHYSLPTLREFFKADDGSCVFAMTYVEGKTLDKIVEKQGGALHPEHVCWMSQRLLNALHYLHHHGAVHCDVKPNNIIIKPEEHNAVLVDYGFSTIKPGRFTKPKGYTMVFAAPELLAERPPLPETDLYSLGATMIYALGGNPEAKTYPKSTPREISDFFDQFVRYDPRSRPNWEQKDLVKELSNIRVKVFGRKRSNRPLVV